MFGESSHAQIGLNPALTLELGQRQNLQNFFSPNKKGLIEQQRFHATVPLNHYLILTV
jgi:hypothetical protein